MTTTSIPRTVASEQPVILFEVDRNPVLGDAAFLEVWRGAFQQWWESNLDGFDAFGLLDDDEYRRSIHADLIKDGYVYDCGFVLRIDGELL